MITKRKILSAIFALLLICCFSLSSIRADDTTDIPVDSPGTSEEVEEDAETPDFISSALKSLDEEIAKKEDNQNYVKNFYNSSSTAKTKGMSLFSADSILMTILNVVTMLIEMIGIAVTFVIMLLYNVVASSFISGVVQGVFDVMDGILFDWSNPNSWISKLLLIATLMGVLYQLIKGFTKFTNWKQIAQLVLSAFISMSFVVFIGVNGRNIVGGIETSLNTMLAQTFVFDGEAEPEITNKNNIFEILQVQPFMLRNYGTTSYDVIAKKANQSETDAKNRVQALLDNPSEKNAKKEYDEYKNKIITHNSVSASQALFHSAVCFVHRIAIGFVIIVLCIATGAVKLAKDIMIGLSIYQLIWWMIKRDHKAKQWFTDRIIWCIASIVADVLFTGALYFVLNVCRQISETHVFLMIGFDLLLIALIIFVIKNASTIGAKLKDDGGILLNAMLTGSQSPIDTMKKIGNSHKSNEMIDSDGQENSSDPSEDLYKEDLAESGADFSKSESNDDLAEVDDGSLIDDADSVTEETQKLDADDEGKTSESKQGNEDVDSTSKLKDSKDDRDENVVGDEVILNTEDTSSDDVQETEDDTPTETLEEDIEEEHDLSDQDHESEDLSDDDFVSNDESESSDVGDQFSDINEGDVTKQEELHDQDEMIEDETRSNIRDVSSSDNTIEEISNQNENETTDSKEVDQSDEKNDLVVDGESESQEENFNDEITLDDMDHEENL